MRNFLYRLFGVTTSRTPYQMHYFYDEKGAADVVAPMQRIKLN